VIQHHHARAPQQAHSSPTTQEEHVLPISNGFHLNRNTLRKVFYLKKGKGTTTNARIPCSCVVPFFLSFRDSISPPSLIGLLALSDVGVAVVVLCVGFLPFSD
jgi:hypothetical protein